ncbi:MAG TPA: type IV pilin N-terminal domain-containing protein [Methanospirillum sp.]|nr:type IV pilin N-terminal domain-containing protein [Methanospirillum sp.]
MRRDQAVSELMGALLMVALIMTGMSIISVMLFSVPPPTITEKAVLGIKCTWCPELNKYDILVDHEGGENLSLKDLKFTVMTNSTAHEITPKYIYATSDPIQVYKPPISCKDTEVNPARLPWDPDRILSVGQSLKCEYIPGSATGEPIPTFLMIQEPSSLGHSSLVQLKISYIQNLIKYSSIAGAGAFPVSGGSDCLRPFYVKKDLAYTPDGCDVNFTYTNTCPEMYGVGYGDHAQPWNYLVEFGDLSTSTILSGPVTDFSSGAGIAMHVKFKGTVEYRLGYRSSQITCDERIIAMLKK